MTDVYVVWGPTAEWGDGSGPLFYTLTRESAESYIEDEKRTTVDHAAQVSDSFAAADSEGLEADYEAARIRTSAGGLGRTVYVDRGRSTGLRRRR